MKINPVYLLLFVLSLSALPLPQGCGRAGTDRTAPPAVPSIEVASTSPDLRRAKGFLYRNDTLFAGLLVESYESGARKSLTPYYGGREEGTARGWYPNGTPMFERSYIAGKKEGIHQGWWENGRRRFLYHFAKDMHEGQAEEWYPEGTLFRKFHYEKGEEEGREQMWNEDGTLQANYVVVKGRRYGSIGSKPCTSE